MQLIAIDFVSSGYPDCDRKDSLQVDISWRIVSLIVPKSTHFPGIFANALDARATRSIWAPKFEVFALHFCLLVMLLVCTLRPGPDYSYLDENSSIFSREDKGKSELQLSDIDIIKLMRENW